jgi:hypothetical protein
MLVGLGDLGGLLLEMLAREPSVARIVVVSRSAARGTARCNVTRLGALAHGYHPVIEFHAVDLEHVESMAELLHRVAPDILLSTATRLTWWVTDLLPGDAARALKPAGFGVWLPVHLAPTVKLMRAVADASYGGVTLIAPYPDVVSPVLERLGLAPTSGIGNVDEIVAKVRLLVAQRLGAGPERVRVWLVAHHALQRASLWGGEGRDVPPYLLRVAVDGEDVTESVSARGLLLEPLALATGRVTHFVTAGSAMGLIRALAAEHPVSLHEPGPGGLPGGYPVRVSRRGVDVELDGVWSLEDAVGVNVSSHRFDGVAEIHTDGTVAFVPEAADVLRQTLQYHCERLPPGDVDARAEELVAKFREYAGRFAVAVP